MNRREYDACCTQRWETAFLMAPRQERRASLDREDELGALVLAVVYGKLEEGPRDVRADHRLAFGTPTWRGRYGSERQTYDVHVVAWDAVVLVGRGGATLEVTCGTTPARAEELVLTWLRRLLAVTGRTHPSLS